MPEQESQGTGSANTHWDRLPSETQEALKEFARALARITARVMVGNRIQVDMDDPAVAREMLQITFDAVCLGGAKRAKSARRTKARDPSKTKGEARMPGLPLGCVALDSNA
ncbi:hypothetical protein ACFFF7_16035 [Novosphingobium aquiterrae]|uniref:Uncharacterized protein n=1 Tax=Novosphingobium aquiterrae TaxID=624388 RepID=A0ABV6PM49_9SPHN